MVGAYALIHHLWLDDMKFSRNRTEEVKVTLLAMGIGIVALRWAWLRWLEPRGDSVAQWSSRVLAFLMLTLCFCTLTNYGRHGTRLIADRIDVYDVIHYYLGPKYFDELGYFDLYPACILADMENGGPHFTNPPTYQAQDIDGYEVRAFNAALKHGQQVKARFSEERWQAFSHDFITLQREYYGLTTKYWQQLVNDHGFNGTPAWTGYAAPLVNLVPVESVKLLGYLDIGLVLVGIAVGWWAFGGWSAAFLFFFLLTTYSTRWPTFSWAILRYDYAVALIIATAMAKKGKPLLAGICAGHAAAMRIFPATWLLGPGVQGAWQLLRHRRLSVYALVFFLGVVGWIGLLETNFAAQFGGQAIVTHWKGMTDHMKPENLSSRREGLAIALAYRGERNEGWSFKRIDRVGEQETPRKVVGVLMILALAWALRRADRAEAFALGFVPFFALATASYYYYVVRAPLILIHACDLRKTRNAVALAFLLGAELFCNYAQQYMGGNRIFVIGWLGWSLLLYCLGMIVVLLVEDAQRGKQSDPAPEQA